MFWGVIIGLIIGAYTIRIVSRVFVACYFMSTGRSQRASYDIARVILNGAYIKEMKN